jgi:CHASE3 domain sensor protein
MKTILRENAIHLAISLVFLLIIVGGVLSYYNWYTMNKALAIKEQSEEVMREIDLIHDNIRFMDISGRGYALIRKKEFLFWDLKSAQNLNKVIFRSLDSLFYIQQFSNVNYDKMKKALDHYTSVFSRMVQHLENGETEQYLAMLEHDYGKTFYQTYTPLLDEIAQYEKTLAADAQENYGAAVLRNRIVQVLLIILGLPTLFWIFYRIRRDDRERRKLLLDLEKNNKQYLFDSGRESEREAKLILQTSISDLQQASKFVSEISAGNYNVQWNGLCKENDKLNKENLAGKLLFMRDEMSRIKEEDRKRIWSTQGLSDVSDILRRHQGNLGDLNWHVLTFLVKYSGAQQGSLFITKHNNEDTFLELAACYAFERRKFVEKIINPGEGLIGEAFLSGDTTLLKKVPSGYISITSGLGDASPTCIVIVPMKHNDQVMAILEIASFSEFESYQVAFLEKAGEFVASAVATTAQNERNKLMMEQLSSQTEELRAQEEELRQNIEELEATQETMRRQTTAAK